MPINSDDIVELLTILGEEENINIAVKGSICGGVITGLAAVAGGLILGPIGLAVGGATGGVIASIAYKDKFMSVGEALRKMSYRDKEQLASSVKSIMTNIDATDVVHLMAIVSGDPLLRQTIIGVLRNHLANEMGLPILIPPVKNAKTH